MMMMVIIIDGYDYGYYDGYFNEITWWIWSIKLLVYLYVVYMANCLYKWFNVVTWFNGYSLLTLLDLGYKYLLRRLVTFL